MAVFTILSGFSINIFEWAVYRGVVSFFTSIFSPFTIALVIDLSRNMQDTMVSREFFLNSGRIFGTMIVIGVILLSGDIKNALVISGAIILFYPLILWSKKKEYNIKV